MNNIWLNCSNCDETYEFHWLQLHFVTAPQYIIVGSCVYLNMRPIMAEVNKTVWIDVVDNWAQRAQQMIKEWWARDQSSFMIFVRFIIDAKRWDLILATNASYKHIIGGIVFNISANGICIQSIIIVNSLRTYPDKLTLYVTLPSQRDRWFWCFLRSSRLQFDYQWNRRSMVLWHGN